MSPEKQRPQDRPDPSDQKHRPRRLRHGGGYRDLRSFQAATLIYDATVSFCTRWIDPRSRTHDQMVQAARSGRQNIAEASRAGATSGASEIHLTNVARASLDELLLDYEDFLRQRGLARWAKDSPEAIKVRQLGRKRADQTDPTDRTDKATPYSPWLANPDPGIVANALICLIHQANYLLDRQIWVLERAVIEKGGYRETLMAARLAEREWQRGRSDRTDRTDPSDQPPPLCPRCGQPMRLRTARQGKNAGSRFWGCPGYPECKGTRALETGKIGCHRPDQADRTDPTDGPKTGGKKP